MNRLSGRRAFLKRSAGKVTGRDHIHRYGESLVMRGK